jgi:hypothetical protein
MHTGIAPNGPPNGKWDTAKQAATLGLSPHEASLPPANQVEAWS